MSEHYEVQPEVRMGWITRACVCKWAMAVQATKPNADDHARKALFAHMQKARANAGTYS